MTKFPRLRTPLHRLATAAVLLAALAAPAVAQPLPAGWQAVVGTRTLAPQRLAPRLPAQAASDEGVTVRITDASRVVTGGDDVIDIMEALGLGRLVFAAPERSVTEAGQRARQHFLFNRTTGAEGILSLDGTLFIGNSLRRHGKLAETLRTTGLPALVIDDVQPVPQKLRKVAAVFGLQREGEALAQTLQTQLDAAVAVGKLLPRPPRVLHVSATGGGGKPTVGGRDTAAAQLIRLAGGINVGDAAQAADYTALSNEGVVAAAPEVVLLTQNDLVLLGGETGLWRSYPTLRQTPAGQNNRVWVMPDNQLKVLGTASGAGAIALAQALRALPAAK